MYSMTQKSGKHIVDSRFWIHDQQKLPNLLLIVIEYLQYVFYGHNAYTSEQRKLCTHFNVFIQPFFETTPEN